MEQFNIEGYWTSFLVMENGYPLIAYECSVCHKYTYKGKIIAVPLDYCPNCHSEMADDEI